MKRIQHDYKPGGHAARQSDHRIWWFVAGVGIPLICLALLWPHGDHPDPAAAETMPTAPGQGVAGPGPATKPVPPPPAGPSVATPGSAAVPKDAPAAATGRKSRPPSADRVTVRVRRGDSLDRIFRRNHLSRGDLANIMLPQLSREYLRMLRPGEEITIRHAAGRVLELTREIDLARSLGVWRSDHGYVAGFIDHPPEVRQVLAGGRIKSSLFEAAAEAGVSDRIIMNLTGIFAWDIDFVLDIRAGDSFSVIYAQLWRDGKKLGDGDILAAEFINQGRAYRAVRYQDPAGRVDYFTPDGTSVRKAFLRAPLTFSRISSNFNPHRRHPILHTIRAHQGVDYAAPRGTPVKAAGDGKVIYRGRKGGYGNTVILQHGSNITTLYAHLSRFAKSARFGARVRQGEVIAYVGSTGLATAPHLHYEYRVNGVHMNPRTVKLPDAAPIDRAYLGDFQKTARPLLHQLDRHSPLLVRNTPVAG